MNLSRREGRGGRNLFSRAGRSGGGAGGGIFGGGGGGSGATGLIGGALTVYGAYTAGKAVYDRAKEMEKLAIATRNVTGSAVEASKALDYVKKIANYGGQDIQTSMDLYNKIFFAARDAGLDKNTARKMYENATVMQVGYGLIS